MQNFSTGAAAREDPPSTGGQPNGGPATPTLTVVVCAYTLDRWDDTSAALQSLRDQDRPPDQVILVTDHNDELNARAGEAFRDVLVVPNAERRGLSGARNTGIAAAEGTVVAFLDDDAAAEPDWTVRLLEGYDDPAVLGVGGGITPRWESGRPRWFPAEFDWVVGCSYRGLPEQPASIRNMIGANMSLRHDVLDAVGGFSNELGRTGTLPLGCEETELCIRAGRHYRDGVFLYLPDAQVRHHVPTARGTWRYFLSRCWREGQSKAAVTLMAGRQRALSSERSYLLRTVPQALARAARPGGGSPPLSTATAVLLGVLCTMLGYLHGGVRSMTLRQVRAAAAGGLPLVAALLLWAWSLPRTRVDDLNGVGLAAAVPWSYWTALGVLVLGFGYTLYSAPGRSGRSGPERTGPERTGPERTGADGSSPGNPGAGLRPYAGRPRSALWPALYTVALLLVQRATQALVYNSPLYAWAWKHIDIIDRLLGNGGHLDRSNRLAALAPYDQWAGFFAGNTAVIRMIGLNGALDYAAWAPLVSSLLLVLPLLLIFQVFSRDQRLVWTAVWIFFLGNWVGQDYLSPQAFGFFLYLGVLALVFRNLARDAPWGRHGEADAGYPLGAARRAELPRADRRRWLWLLVLPIAADAASHQLTPVVLGLGLLVLGCTRRYRNPWLAVLGLLIPAAWDAGSALDFFRLQLPAMAQSFGNLLANSQPGGGATPTGAGPVFVSWVDRGLSAAVAAAAVAGALRHPALRRSGLPLLLVAVVPMPLVVANNYGGEMVFRVFMFALPGLSFFAAAALLPRPRPAGTPPTRWAEVRTAALAGGVLLVLAAVFVPSYTGKDRLDYFPRAEIRLADQLAATAPPGSFIVGADGNYPDAYLHYDQYTYEWLTDASGPALRSLMADPLGYLTRDMAWVRDPAHAYLVITRGQRSDISMQGLLPPGTVDRIQRAVAGSPSFRLILSNQDGVVYQYVPTPTTTPSTVPALP
ncbi:glycosyltransferase family 2 protein [Streptacidiphilus sp. EB129]|uniref:glycosyltransferase family 2 protein n=1 Tax=Streptacidiphilus sp. EB129 TaxID=3156262 RepID=UPI003514E383